MKHGRRTTRAASLLVCGFAAATGAVHVSATTEQSTTEAETTEAAPSKVIPATTAAAAPTTVAAEVKRQPLTGVTIEDDIIYTPRPALVVKIDNVGAARPQTGLNQADIVFEEIVEGRVTRFAAVFNSMDSNPVGPIRSARTQDINLLASLNQPTFAYSGANPGVTAALEASDMIVLGPSDENGFFRSGDRPSPHNLYSSTDTLFTVGDAAGAGDAVAQFQYVAPGTAVAGPLVTFLDLLIGRNRVRWDWDVANALFMRSQGGAPHQLTDGQATANTVVVIVTGYGVSPVDRQSPDAITLGSGEVVVYTNGHKIEGTWTRETSTEPFTLEAGGTPIRLTPGRTWVELVDGANYDLADG